MAAQPKHGMSNPQLKIAAGATVCEDCELIGDITIGARTVIHPKARIVAETGPIIIGEYNIIEELVTIRNTSSTDENSGKVQIIGNNNMFEVGANVESIRVGDNNVIESKAKIGTKVEIANGCIIGAGCELNVAEQLPDNTVVYGENCERRIQREKPSIQALQIDFLTKIMPNYHYLIKPNIQPRPQGLLAEQTLAHVLQECPLLEGVGNLIWPSPVDLRQKLWDWQMHLEFATQFLAPARLIA